MNGKKFQDLINDYGIYKTQLEDYQLYSHVILPPTPDKILFDIFDRVNRGGTKLNKQEIRNALYHGRGLNMITNISKEEIFKEATHIDYAKDARMKGSYLLTRFLSFYLLFNERLFKNTKKYEYAGDVDDLIEATLVQLNREADEKLEQLKQMTLECLGMSKEILGSGAFRREMDESKPINMNIFETTLYFMTLIKGNSIPYYKISQGLRDVISSQEYLDYIGNSRENIRKVNGRFNLMRQLFKEICND